MKKETYKVGIIGAGFVGGAILQGLQTVADIKAYDKYKPQDSFEDTVDSSEFIFLCLPTNMGKGGSVNLSILDEVIEMLANRIKKRDKKIIIIKSTILPGTTDNYQKKYPHLTLIHSMESLTARFARLDWINANRVVIGGKNKKACKRVAELHEARINAPIIITDAIVSELAKYTCNCFFATKIMYFNQIYELCQKLGVDYEDIKNITLLDGRVARSHMDIPGPDGKRFFGNACLPKDCSGLIKFAKEIEIPQTVLEEVNRVNKKERPEWYTNY